MYYSGMPESSENQEPSTPEEAAIFFKKKLKIVRDLQKKIDDALEHLYTKGGITPQQVSDYLNNPKNFKASEFELIQKYRKSVQAFVTDAIGEEGKKQIEQKKATQATKKRARKAVGGRRKWIQMD